MTILRMLDLVYEYDYSSLCVCCVMFLTLATFFPMQALSFTASNHRVCVHHSLLHVFYTFCMYIQYLICMGIVLPVHVYIVMCV